MSGDQTALENDLYTRPRVFCVAIYYEYCTSVRVSPHECGSAPHAHSKPLVSGTRRFRPFDPVLWYLTFPGSGTARFREKVRSSYSGLLPVVGS